MDDLLDDYNPNDYNNDSHVNQHQQYNQSPVPTPGYSQNQPQTYQNTQPQQQAQQQHNNNQNHNHYSGYGQQSSPQSQPKQSYQKPNEGYSQRTGEQLDWREKAKQIQPPYMPVGIFFERDLPPNIVEDLLQLASKLINLGFTVRYNSDNIDIHKRMRNLSFNNTEDYGIMKDFKPTRDGEAISARFCWNNNTSNDIAQKNLPNFDPSKKLLLMSTSRNVRIILGNTNKNNIKFLITYSPDGASKLNDCTTDTGNARYMIQLADRYYCPVFNIGNQRQKEYIDNKIINRGY